MRDIAVVLHNIRSAHNVGSIFRTADGAGAARVCLVGYTPLPIDRFGRPQKEIAKTALGAEELPWTHFATLTDCIEHLRSDGYRIVGVEQDERARDYATYEGSEKIALVFGNEVDGLSLEERSLCDDLVEIPMRGKKESLNVSVAAGIVLFSLSG